MGFRTMLMASAVAAACSTGFGASAAEPASSNKTGTPDSAASADKALSNRDIPPIPKGYASLEEAMAAFTSGTEKLVALNGPLPENVVVEEDIEYGRVGERSLRLDLYRPRDLRENTPALVFIHGGGWRAGDKTNYRFYAAHFAQRGYVAVSVGYRLVPEATFPAAVEDVKCAIRFLRAHADKYQIDPKRIAALGGSAGGHLALMLGYTADMPALEGSGGWQDASSRVQAVVDIYGPCDFSKPVAEGTPTVRDFLGATYAEAPDRYALASPFKHLSKGDPPTLVFHGTIDQLVPIEQSDALVQRLKELAIPCVYERYDGLPHGMDLVESVNKRCLYVMSEFLDAHLGGPGRGDAPVQATQ